MSVPAMKCKHLFALIALGAFGLFLITPADAARRTTFPTNPGDGSIPLVSPP